MAEKEKMTARYRVHELFAHESATAAGRTVRAVLILLIALSVITTILESIPPIRREHGALLDAIQLFATLGFAIEYALRIWVAPEDPGHATAARGCGSIETMRVARPPSVTARARKRVE